MSDLQFALREVGFKPTKPKPFAKVLGDVIATMTAPPKIEVRERGGIFIARFPGHADCVFGSSASDARKRLMLWESYYTRQEQFRERKQHVQQRQAA